MSLESMISRSLVILFAVIAAGARTSFFAPELNHFYLAVPQQGNQEAEIRVYEISQG